MAESVIRRHAKRLRHRTYRVTIDLDPTDDPTHGAQQLSFFNGHYDTWCYLPVMGFVSFNDEAEQYLCAAVLRPGNVSAAAGAVGILRRLVRMIRHHLSGVQIRYAWMAVLRILPCWSFWTPSRNWICSLMAKNTLLKRVVESGMQRARQLSRRSGKTEHIYGEVRYKAGKWPGLRRVIIKAEVVRAADKDPKDNPRFVITNMKQSPQWIYERVYCQRGDIENRIKELHELDIDRTSCSSFWANQFRVLLTAAAYVLMQELRLRAAGTACARAQVGTLRERLLKLGARVLVSVRRVVVICRFLPVSTRLPSCGSGARRGNRLNPFSGLLAQPNSTPTTVTAPCLSIRQLEHPDLGTLRFLCSFARPNPTIGIYNPLRTNNWALAMSSRIMRVSSTPPSNPIANRGQPGPDVKPGRP